MILEVSLGETHVGELRPVRPYNVLQFFIDPAYWNLAPRPVLGQLFEDRHPGALVPSSIDPFALPDFFAHLLPEVDGALRRLLARRLRLDEHADADFIQLLGRDLPGNVLIQVRTPGQPQATSRQRSAPPPDRLRFSLGGIQLKFSTLRNLATRRLALPASGMGGNWILKLPAEGLPELPENEWAMMTWAKQSGLDVPDFDLIDHDQLTDDGELADLVEPGRHCYACRRFDRRDVGRVQIEDFAQIFGMQPDTRAKYLLNYESIGNVIARVAPDDLKEYIRRLTFMVLSGNGDAHLKNWSLIYPDGVHPRLSPAYDLVATVAYPLAARRELALRLHGHTSFDDVALEDFRRLAQTIGVTVDSIDAWVRTAVEQILDAWRDVRPALDSAPVAVAAVVAHHARLRSSASSIVHLRANPRPPPPSPS
jgi:serine/threonine-protein kinase HipA